MSRPVRILLLLAALAALACSCRKKPRRHGVPAYGAFSATDGSYELTVRYRFELRHATGTPEATTGSLIASHTNDYDCACSWTLVGASDAGITVREKFTRYRIHRIHDDPAGEAAFRAETGQPMPVNLKREHITSWRGFTLETDYTSGGVVAKRRIVGRPPYALVTPEATLEESLGDPRSFTPLHPGSRPPVLIAESSWNAGPELVNPIPVIRWPARAVAPGDSWQQGGHKDAVIRFNDLELRGDYQIAHISWNWEVSPKGFPDTLAQEMKKHEMRMTAAGRSVFNATRQRVIDYVSTDTIRHRQDVTRGSAEVDAVRLSTTTITLRWTYSE